MKIGLLGFEFESSNKGCEALTYSFLPILNDIEDDLEIYVFNIHDSLGYVPAMFPKIKFINLPIRMKSIKFWKSYLISLKKCDVVFDITHGDSFSDIYGKKWLIQTNLLKQAVILKKIPLILLPQTYGPFENGLLLKWSKSLIDNSYKVYCRDNKSADYIRKELKCKNTIPYVTSDLAFSLPYKKLDFSTDKINIGINISGLLWNYDKLSNNNIKLKVDYKKYCKGLISALYNDEQYNIYLIPHVICNEREGIDYYDNDCGVLRKIKEDYPKCIYEEDFKTILDIKNYIASLDILVSSRMHASIGAYSANVCSIPFAYSRKFSGVYNDLRYDFLIDGQNLETDAALKLTLDYIRDYKNIVKKSSKSMEKVKKSNRDFIENLKNTMENM